MIDAFSKNGNIAETLELMDLIQRDPRIFEIFKAAATAPNGYINIETVSKRWIMTTRQHVYDAADVLIWLGIAVVTLWALGKAMGWISSPIWVDMVPIFGGIATIAGISIKVGRVLQKLDVVIDDVGRIEGEVKEIDKRVAVLEASKAQNG